MSRIHPNHYTADDVAVLLTNLRGRKDAEAFEASLDAAEEIMQEAADKDDRVLLHVAGREYGKLYDTRPYCGEVNRMAAVAFLKVLGIIPDQEGSLKLWERTRVDDAMPFIAGAIKSARASVGDA